MKVTEILMKEHQFILERLSILNELISKRDSFDIYKVEESIRFIQLYADEFHHAKEEDIYFKWLGSKNPMYDNGPLPCMLSEHDQGRAFVKNAQEAIKEYKLGNEEKMVDIIENLISFITLLRDHIHKEDNVLYNMAEKENSISGDGDAMMLDRFIDTEKQYLEVFKEFDIAATSTLILN